MEEGQKKDHRETKLYSPWGKVPCLLLDTVINTQSQSNKVGGWTLNKMYLLVDAKIWSL